MPNVVPPSLEFVSVRRIGIRLLNLSLVTLSLLGTGAKSVKALDWQKVATGNNGALVVWVDVDSIKILSANSKIVEYFYFSREKGVGLLDRRQADCVNGQTKTVYGKIFNPDGTLREEGPGGGWEGVQPGKLGYDELRFACGKVGL